MKAAKKPAAQAYFRAFYQNNRLRFALGMILTGMKTLCFLVVSWILGAILDIIAVGDMGQLWHLTRFIAVFLPLSLALDLAAYRVRTSFTKKALVQYKALAFQNLSEKSISAFSRENTGRYISVLTNDVNTIEENYLNRSFLLLYHCASFVTALGMMFFFSPLLASAAILFSLLPIAVSVLMGGELARREEAVSDRNERFVTQVKDLLSGFSVIKSFKAEEEAQTLFHTASCSTEEAKARRRWWDFSLVACANACGSLVQFGVFLLGAFLAIRGSITAGTVIIIVNLCNNVLSPIQVVPQYWAGRKAAKALVEKLAQVTEENAGRSGEAIPPVLDEAISLDHVTFGYEPDKPVLQDVSLRLEPGKKYAIVGGSGSGKSTLLNLLMGAYDSYGGSITIDGRELRGVDPDSLYDLMSLIGQSVFLFDDTIRRNITMFRDFPDQLVDDAVKRSGLSELLAQRGENYRCGENGVALSGGERQRVSIARCLLRGAPVLLLDEATASLDNQTAFAVTDAILHLDGLTRVVVTHRLDAALMGQYDEIIVLRNGRVQERGSFSRLMAQKAFFYSLYTLSA